jgi:hypothetical protein
LQARRLPPQNQVDPTRRAEWRRLLVTRHLSPVTLLIPLRLSDIVPAVA